MEPLPSQLDPPSNNVWFTLAARYRNHRYYKRAILSMQELNHFKSVGAIFTRSRLTLKTVLNQQTLMLHLSRTCEASVQLCVSVTDVRVAGDPGGADGTRVPLLLPHVKAESADSREVKDSQKCPTHEHRPQWIESGEVEATCTHTVVVCTL